MNSRVNDDANMGDTFCLNSDTDRQLDAGQDELCGTGEGSENLEPSEKTKSRRIRFDNINRLGDKRRSKSITNGSKAPDRPHVSGDCQPEDSTRK